MKTPLDLEYPADIEGYLPPDLWRKLSSGQPQRRLLIQALDRLRSLLYLLSTFIPSNLVQEKMKRAVPGLVSGEILKGSLLFADVSGFTALSERLAALGPEGAERLTATINGYFVTILKVMSSSGGILLKFAGDAMLIYFPEQENNQQAQWAVRAGMRMLRAIQDFASIETPLEAASLRMKVGVSTGEFLSASVGSARRMEYAILGDVVSQTMAAEGAATAAGQLVVSESTVKCLDSSFSLGEHAPGFYLVEQSGEEELDDFEIKAEKRRARGSIPLDASPPALVAQMEDTVAQIRALRPYIADELVARIIAHAQQRKVESEFLTATVLFCNFVGADALLEIWGQEGADRVTNLLSAYFTAVNNLIARYGGIITRIDPYSKGTKLLALFGAPVSHQDDPLRAVRAALMMNVELEVLNERWHKKFARHLPLDFSGALIQHCIGITVGETFAGQVGSSTRREYTVMGDDVNLSARLMGAAKMGQILISQPVYEAAANFFFFTELSPIQVKGKSEPIPIYQADGPRTDTLLNRVHQRGRLVGRDDELAQGEKILHQALGGECASLTIQGPAGIGKSHLVDMLLQQAISEGAEVLSYQCNSYNAEIPYACWSGILRSMAGITTTDPDLLRREKLQRLFVNLGIPDQHTAHLVKLDKKGRFETSQKELQKPSKLTSNEQTSLLDAVSSLLVQALSRSPLVLFFEDAHWMDAVSRQILLHLQDSLKSAQLLIVLAQRGAQDQPSIGETINLESLDKTGTTQLVAEVLVSDLAQIIHQHSKGNPLFIHEITGWIQQSWQISTTDVINALQTSDVLKDLVLSSLENLPENQREITRVGSVIGEEFRVGELQALLPSSVDSVTLYNDLRGLVDARFISLIEAGIDPRYAFQQKLVRDILYNSLPFARRRELHTRMADYLVSPATQRSAIHAKINAFLDASAVNNPVQDAKIVAFHYEAAEKWELAAQSLLRAADHLMAQDTYVEASEIYYRALLYLKNLPSGVTDPDFLSLKYRLLVGQGDSALLCGDYAQAVSTYKAALAVPLGDKSSEDLAALKGKLALVLPMVDKADEAEKILRELLIQEGAALQNLAIAAALVWLLWRADAPEMADWIEKCRAMMPVELDSWSMGIVALLDDFNAQWETAITKYHAIDQPMGAALASIRLGDQYLLVGDESGALKHYEEAHRIFSELSEGECGLALAQYRMADVSWREQDAVASRAHLDKMDALLFASPAGIRDEGRTLIISAIAAIKDGGSATWPDWRWRFFDDCFRIRLLYQRK